ncbi:ATP-binding domain-containing protein [Streptomyces rhizosphaerihabitans]|uniref:ATP-binding domain-containing protein n=1 Tax=Streptomyces rhizosphaerihabitans TaxID=1266770 RepID=UPI0021C24251|nr:ATP-binding domain-containing protein [Streptomyces rhizosphaerihabitans]MCT9003601.1 AAA family ATPase [Streptomyces rhizosphaerihabitans]
MSTTPRDAVIAIEQKAVDRAYDCYEARLAEMTSPSTATASASGKDGVAVRRKAESTAEEYGGLGGEALVISRVDVQEPGDAEPETFYVGRRHVFDTETRDQVVVSWTNPIAVSWHNARPETPGEVLLRRRLRCAERTVEDFLDEITPAAEPRTGSLEPGQEAASSPAFEDEPAPLEASEAPGTLEAPGTHEPEEAQEKPESTTAPPTGNDVGRPRTVPSPRHAVGRRRQKPQPVDEFLLRELRRSRSGRMRDIVETIRRDQMALVTGSPADILVIQGGPGTGKSAVGLHRVTWLVNNDHFRAQDILVVGPHQNFLEYVGRVLPTLGTRNVTAVQLARLWEGEIQGADSTAARLVKSDERMAAVLRRRVESECRPEAVDTVVSAPSHAQDEAAFVVVVGSTSLRLPRSEVLGLLQEAREGPEGYRARRDRFRTLLVDRLLGELVRIAPRRSRDATVRRDLERNRQVTTLVDRVWPALSPEEALRGLLNSPTRLGECASGILDAGEQALLQRPKAESAAEEPWTIDDLVCLEELRSLIAGESPQRYRHIVVDEAQDLTPMQARSLRRRCPTGSMTVLGDLAQATGPHSYTGWGQLGGILSAQGDWRVAELNTSYRVPAEIMEFVAPLARAVAPSLPYPTAVRRAGDEAVRLVSTTPWELLDDAAARTARLVGTDDGRSPRSIAVIVPDDSDWLEEVRRRVDLVDGVTEEMLRTVSVLPAAQAKGMEFDHVLVLEPATIADRGPAGLRQLYVALTRSTQTLTVLHTTPLPLELGTTVDDADGEVSSALSHLMPTASPSRRTPGAGGSAPDGSTLDDSTHDGAPADELPVGAAVEVRVLGPGPGSHWKVKVLAPATERTVLLVPRHGEPTPTTGSRLDGWVTRNEGRLSLVSAGDFGRRPISARMAPRYEAALGVLRDIADGDGATTPETTALLSELRGMASRCLRRDRVDWLSVWRLLGSADRDRLNDLADLAQRTRQAVASDAPGLRAALTDDPAFRHWTDALDRAQDELRHRIDTDPESKPEPGPGLGAGPNQKPNPEPVPELGPELGPEPSTVSAPNRAPGPATAPEAATARPEAITAPPTEPRTTHEQKDTDPMNTAPLLETDHAPSEGRAAWSEALARQLDVEAQTDRDCNTHEAVRFELRAALLRAGLRPADTRASDAILEGPDGFFRYEVLGAGRCGYTHLRAGAVRLMELDRVETRSADTRYLVLSGPPTEDWAPHAIREAFGVHVVWRTAAGWHGPDARTALHLTD